MTNDSTRLCCFALASVPKYNRSRWSFVIKYNALRFEVKVKNDIHLYQASIYYNDDDDDASRYELRFDTIVVNIESLWTCLLFEGLHIIYLYQKQKLIDRVKHKTLYSWILYDKLKGNCSSGK